MLVDRLQPSKILFNDVNQKCIEVAKTLHRNTNIEFHCFDVTCPYEKFDVDVVINTSCEHMQYYDHMKNESTNCVYVCQSCDNKNDPGHVNTSSTTEEFIDKLSFSRVIFSGRFNLGHKNRFMVIGQN